MSKFESIRAHLSHFVLRNGILARLGITSDILAASDPERSERMAKRVLEIDVVSQNHRAALKAWYGGPGFETGVRQTVSELFTVVVRLRSIRPTAQFPSEKVVNGWLDQMERFFGDFENFSKMSTAEREASAQSFADGATCFLNFLSRLDANSETFKTYFERT